LLAQVEQEEEMAQAPMVNYPTFNFEPPEDVKVLSFSPALVKLNQPIAQYVPTKSEWYIGYICNLNSSGMMWASHDLGAKKKNKPIRSDVAIGKTLMHTMPDEYGTMWHFIERTAEA